jgi:hypothetical protein
MCNENSVCCQKFEEWLVGIGNWVEGPTNVQVRQGTLGLICFDQISQLEFVSCNVANHFPPDSKL